jgi:hypothetical protein
VYGLREEVPNGLKTVAQLASLSGCTPGRPSKCAFFSSEAANKDLVPFNEFNTRVTQKMETPVIYFYGNKGEKVHVEVGFPGGMISQWFPAATSFNQHQNEFKNGFMGWDVTLKDVNDTAKYPKTNATSIWNPARVTKANTIQANVNGSEEERFIFYRGLGDFNVPLKLKLKSLPKNVLKVTLLNDSDEAVPALFYVLSTKQKGIVNSLALPALNPHEEKSFETSLATSSFDVRAGLKTALVNAGLFEDEAMSMINTWDKSYFHTEGERLLYVLPRTWTEKILPMKLVPAPEKLNRVLVGRVELFSSAAQANLLNNINKNVSFGADHLMEAKQNALKLLK